MARGRMLSKSLSTSKKFALVGRSAGEFPQLLYTLMVPHADDFGRQEGDAFTVKHKVHPTSARTEEEFGEALQALANVGLIEWYDAPDSTRVIQIVDFDVHQGGLHKRSQSDFAPRTAGELSASERDVEAFIAEELTAKRLAFEGFEVISVERQVRIGNSYLDIVAKTSDGTTFVIEVKRQRVSTAAVEQVMGYMALVSQPAVPVVIGYGLAAGFQVANCGALIAVYGDDLAIRQLTSLNVKARLITLSAVTDNRTELNRTEGNRTEGKRTEGGGAARTHAQAPGPLAGSLPRDHIEHGFCGTRFCVSTKVFLKMVRGYGAGADAESATSAWLRATDEALGPEESVTPFSVNDRWNAHLVRLGRVSVAPVSSTASAREQRSAAAVDAWLKES